MTTRVDVVIDKLRHLASLRLRSSSVQRVRGLDVTFTGQVVALPALRL